MKLSDQPPPITPEQLREARAALGWSRDRLAVQSDTTTGFIGVFEDTGRVAKFLWHPNGFDALGAIRTALEAAGVEFIQENSAGPDVRLRTSAKAGMTHPPQLTPQQVKAARNLLKWPQERLAAQSGITCQFIWAYEKKGRVMKMFSRDRSLDGLAAIRSTLEAAGVEFINGDEPGVKLNRKDESDV